LSAASTTAEILEATFDLTAGCVNFEVCYTSAITVPPPAGSATFSPYLTIVLRMDASNIKQGTKIGSVVPEYDGVPVGLCASPTTPRTDGKPCIASSTAYPKNNKAPLELQGDFEWVIINLVNGTYRLP
jgi:hypothetical protein